MALDVYVGSLTRYYAGDWQNAAQQSARPRGGGATAVRPRAPRSRTPDLENTRAAVLAWREALVASLASVGEGTAVRIDWDEAADAPYFTGRPGWDGFGALVLWAAYAEHPTLARPVSLLEKWDDDDPALARCNADGFRSRYSHLVRNVEMWLPAPLQFTFEGEDVDNHRIVIGSVTTLGEQLAELNGATWNAAGPEVARWAREVPKEGAALELQARYAFSVLSGLTRQTAEHRLPLKLDL